MNGRSSCTIWIYFFANAIDKGLRCSRDCFHIHGSHPVGAATNTKWFVRFGLICGPGETPEIGYRRLPRSFRCRKRVCPSRPDKFCFVKEIREFESPIQGCPLLKAYVRNRAGSCLSSCTTHINSKMPLEGMEKLNFPRNLRGWLCGLQWWTGIFSAWRHWNLETMTVVGTTTFEGIQSSSVASRPRRHACRVSFDQEIHSSSWLPNPHVSRPGEKDHDLLPFYD
jgi:hypothetical protein